MAKVKFYLKTPDETESLIFAVWNFGYSETDLNGKKKFKFFKYYVPRETIKTKFWNPEIQRAKETLKFAGYSEFNTKLNKLESDILNVWRTLTNDKIIPTPELLRIELDKIYNPQPEPQNLNLFSFIENFIKTVKYIYKNGKPEPISQRTIKKYKTTLSLLREFAEVKRKNNLDFDNINLDFYKDLMEFMQKEKSFSYNYCGKHIATIKKFLNTATEAGINTKLDYKSKRFAVPEEETEKIYLTESELLKLYKLDLTNNKRLDTVRDLFLIGCYTALRYSDYSNIRPENIYNNDGGTFLHIKTQKTGKTVIIPIHWTVKEILKKYSNELPRAITNQKMNDYLKELGKLAGINDKVSISINKGGIRVDTTKYKYELITTHTARRTGATIMYLNKIPVQSIMKLTGHQSEKSFMTYLKFTEEDNANILVNNPFFRQTKMKIV